MNDQAAGHPVSGIGLIAAERQRQIEEEEYTSSFDDGYTDGELLKASLAYSQCVNSDTQKCPVVWPWSAGTWKPHEDCVRNLVKSGALIAAEIDRLIRRDLTTQDSG